MLEHSQFAQHPVALGGVVRGVAVGAVVGLSLLPFVAVHIHDVGMIVFHGFAGSLLLSLLGLWLSAETKDRRFDEDAA